MFFQGIKDLLEASSVMLTNLEITFLVLKMETDRRIDEFIPFVCGVQINFSA